jgi:polyisoprenyl-teichoic acid--peptidoglycan teichoic acid transferase
MFEQLDDPDEFEIGESFFSATSRRFARRQRNRTAARVAGGAACLAVATPAFFGAYQSQRIDGVRPVLVPDVGDTSVASNPPEDTEPRGPATPETLPTPDSTPLNFLIVGTDNASCTDSGLRADTIMVLRLDPGADLAAVLSFPRDLWVGIPGGGKARINGVYRPDDPQLLIDTLGSEFGVPIDHYIQMDYCGFEKLVDAIGGVSLPVASPLRDQSTGLFVPQPGCRSFDGHAALAYVRSRHLEYMDANGAWHEDPSSDPGRIARQQDLLRRVLDRASSAGALQPGLISALYATYRDDLVVDSGLTIDKLVEFAGAIGDVTPESVRGYQIEATGENIAGGAVLVWHKDSANMQAVLDIFRGLAPLGVDAAPDSNAPDSAIVPDPATLC